MDLPRIMSVIVPKMTAEEWAVLIALAFAAAALLDEFTRWLSVP